MGHVHHYPKALKRLVQIVDYKCVPVFESVALLPGGLLTLMKEMELERKASLAHVNVSPSTSHVKITVSPGMGRAASGRPSTS